MPDNADFLKVIQKNVKLVYPKVNQTYRFNTSKQSSEPCARSASGAAWSIGWTAPVEEARLLFAQLKAHYEACRTRNPKLPVFTKIFGSKKAEDGKTVNFTAKRNGMKSDGTENSAPKVIDGMKQPLADLAFWSGSVGSIRAWAYPAIDPDGNGGISLILDTVQVIEPVYGDGGLDDFDEVATAPKASADFEDFGPTPNAFPAGAKEPAAAPGRKQAEDVLGADIPF